MRKVELDVTEMDKFKIIKNLVTINGNKQRAALKLQCTERNINRLIQKYKRYGKLGFVHGNKGRLPVTKISNELRNKIISLYNDKYYSSNFRHFKELLEEEEGIFVSESYIRGIFDTENIVSPKATRKTKRRVKKRLKEMLNHKKIKSKVADSIVKKILSIDESHPRRSRCKYFGEMIQMDASMHIWFGGETTHLHLAIDDAAGEIVGAYFDTQETLNGYYHVTHQILMNYGIPSMFFTDRRTIFEYKKLKDAHLEKDTFTQFSYACNQLGIDINTSSVPQAKGRVERIFNTFQSRLIIEMRLAGVSDINSANVFLNSYIKKYNKKFSLLTKNTKSVFEKQPTIDKINKTLAVIAYRKFDNGHSLRIDNKYFKTVRRNGSPIYFKKGTEAMIIKSFDSQIYANVEDTLYAIEEIPKNEAISKNFDTATSEIKPKKYYIPALDHPWRKSIFKKFIDKNKVA